MAKWKQATHLVTTRFPRRHDPAPLEPATTGDARDAAGPASLKRRASDARAPRAKEARPSASRAPRAKQPFAIPLDVGDRPPDDAAPRAVLERIKRAVAVRTPKPPKPARPVGRPRKDPNVLAVDARERIPGSISHAEMAQLREVATAAGMTPSALVQEIVRLYLSSV